MNNIKKAEELLPKQEKSIRKAIWWIVRELHQEIDAELSREITFQIRENDKNISFIEQRRAIRFLRNIEILEIVTTRYSNNYIAEMRLVTQNMFKTPAPQPMIYVVEIDRNALLDLYKVYEKFFGKDKPDYLSFNVRSGKLIYKKQETVFKPSSNSFTILDILINSTEEFYTLGDTISLVEINDIVATLDGSAEEMKRSSFYNSIKNINDKVKDKMSIREFLVKREGTVGINEDYLREED